MRTIGMALALAFGVAGGMRAQTTDPRVDVTGRAVVLYMSRGAPQVVRGELLAVRRDSMWVLAGRPERIVAVRLGDVLEARVRRHGWTPARSFEWGLGVGAISGLGLAVACSQVSDGCGAVVVGSTLLGGAVGGVAALSFYFSSRWRFRPATEVRLAPFARFPQGPPPGGFDALLRAARDSLVVRP